MEISEEQKRMAAKYEKELEARQKAKAEMESIRSTAEKEADAVARYIQNLDIRLRKTQLIVQHPKTMKQQAVNSQYIIGKCEKRMDRALKSNFWNLCSIGKDLHYEILTHAKEILKLCPTIDEKSKLNGLTNL